jgi:hypothetical protein
LELTPESLLPRFYGCHSIRLYGQVFYFAVMANVFPPSKVEYKETCMHPSLVFIDRCKPVQYSAGICCCCLLVALL